MGKMRTMNCQPLADLIRKAKGDRSLKQYSLDCGISVSNLSKMMNNKSVRAQNMKFIVSPCHNPVSTHTAARLKMVFFVPLRLPPSGIYT